MLAGKMLTGKDTCETVKELNEATDEIARLRPDRASDEESGHEVDAEDITGNRSFDELINSFGEAMVACGAADRTSRESHDPALAADRARQLLITAVCRGRAASKV